MDTELFDLCKEVYKRTGWTPDELFASQVINHVPRYTSDYLLEKLPKFTLVKGKEHWFSLMPASETSWSAFYGLSGSMSIHRNSDTPLKALLKLVIALDDAGELKS